MTIVLPWLLSAYNSWISDYQAQGRYVAVFLIPFAFCFTKGIETIINIIEQSTKSKIHIDVGVLLISFLLIAILVYSFTQYLLPCCFANVMNII